MMKNTLGVTTISSFFIIGHVSFTLFSIKKLLEVSQGPLGTADPNGFEDPLAFFNQSPDDNLQAFDAGGASASADEPARVAGMQFLLQRAKGGDEDAEEELFDHSISKLRELCTEVGLADGHANKTVLRGRLLGRSNEEGKSSASKLSNGPQKSGAERSSRKVGSSSLEAGKNHEEDKLQTEVKLLREQLDEKDRQLREKDTEIQRLNRECAREALQKEQAQEELRLSRKRVKLPPGMESD